MNDIDFIARWRIKELQGDLQRQQRVRRIISQAQDEQLEALTLENQELRLLLTALLEILAEKKVVSPEEIQEMTRKLVPPPPPEEENPFADLGS